jgi:hypothetical protein
MKVFGEDRYSSFLVNVGSGAPSVIQRLREEMQAVLKEILDGALASRATSQLPLDL